MSRPLRDIRFGVLRNGADLCAWEEIVMKKLISEAGIALKLVIFVGNQDDKKQTYPLPEDGSGKPGVFWSLYYRNYIKRQSKALKSVENKKLFQGIPSINCELTLIDGKVTLEASAITEIENSALDFILDFSSVMLSGKILNTPKYGIWKFQFGNPEKYAGSTLNFWEIYREDVITSAYLTRLTEEPDANILLMEGHLKTNIFYPKNIDNIHFEVSDWPLKICRDIGNDLWKTLSPSEKVNGCKIAPPPDNLQLLYFFFVQLKLLIKKVFKLLFYTDYWNIGITLSPIHEFLNPDKIPSIQWFPELPKDRFMADPFGLYFQDRLYIIYEDLRFDQGIGKIASFLFSKGSFGENELVIDEKFHMSYPFLFEHENEVYCIPETYQVNEVRLYKALEFPLKWKFEKVLIENYAAIDSTPFKHGATWFLFSTDKYAGPHHNLNIHYSQSIFGPWHEHPKNPVKTDIRSARPAGTIFTHNGKIFRPSMDYSEKIEGRITINRIVTLTITDFKEEMHIVVNPIGNTFFSDKVHTLSQVGDYTLVDGAKELFIFNNFKVFKHKITRILRELKSN